MKTRLRTSSIGLALGAAVLLGAAACTDDWGQTDPEAGNQVYPTLQTVVTYTFEDEDGMGSLPSDFTIYAYPGGSIPAVVMDEDETQSQILALDNGYAVINNPLNAVTCQAAASLTFWMKQPIEYDEEGSALSSQDFTTPLVAFVQNYPDGRIYSRPSTGDEPTDVADAVYGSMIFTANGMIHYDATDGEFLDNDPSDYYTGYLAPDEWHYVALIVRSTGYGIYVDGYRKVDKVIPNFDCQKMVDFMNNAEYVYLNKDTDTTSAGSLYIDDLTFYRNEITSKQIARGKKGNLGAGAASSGGSSTGSFTYPIATITEIGTSDCTAGWWTTFSDYYTVPSNESLRLSFTNHTSGEGNWNNWNLCVCTGERDGDGYAEYFVIRSDLYGWGGNYGTWESTGYDDWDQFRADMEGAYVTLDIVRDGSTVVVTAVATCANGAVYKETHTAVNCGDEDASINAFLIVDGSYLVMDTANTYYYTDQTVSNKEVGSSDCTAGWWTSFSDYFPIAPNKTLVLDFTNHTSGEGNWNNWNLCVCTGERDGDGYYEYFVIRSDLYGWGDKYGTWESSGYDDWDQFRADMEGAAVNIQVARNDALFDVTATATATNGAVYKEIHHSLECGDGTQDVNAFLIVDGSYLEKIAARSVVMAFR